MTFKPYQGEMHRLLHTPGGPVGRHINHVSRLVAAEARRTALARGLLRSGKYARGFKVEVVPDGTSFYFLVVNRVRGSNPRRKYSYAGVIEKGSQPHLIRPRRKDRWLVFQMPNGRTVRTKLVRHPGTQPQNVLRDALLRVSRVL